MKTFTNSNARDPQQAARLARDARTAGKSVSFVAGGSDLLGLVKERNIQPDVLVNLRTMQGAGQVSSAGGTVTILSLIHISEPTRPY